MAHDDVPRNGKSEPSATLMAGSCRVHAVKPFRQARQMVLGNAGTIIGNA
jgi:hypothetical protein